MDTMDVIDTVVKVAVSSASFYRFFKTNDGFSKVMFLAGAAASWSNIQTYYMAGTGSGLFNFALEEKSKLSKLDYIANTVVSVGSAYLMSRP